MPSETRTFRIFISSTFSDFLAEREALREKVYPRLRDLCRAYGTTFLPVDLLWGVSREAAEDQRSMEICFSEIDRSVNATRRPNFIAMLGDRYGCRPAPGRIPADEFRLITRVLSDDPDGVWQLETLRNWYRRDDNARDPEYRILPKNNQLATAEAWAITEENLSRILAGAASRVDLPAEKLRRYEASATEQEIAHRGLLQGSPLEGEVLYVFRTIEGLPDNDLAGEYRETDEAARGRLLRLVEVLRASGSASAIEYQTLWTEAGPSQEPLDWLCDEVYSRLSNTILSELAESAELSTLSKEIAAHADFVRDRTRYFVGRQDSRGIIQEYMDSAAEHPLLIHGQSGTGKSALLARTVADLSEQSKFLVVSRFIGAVPSSRDMPSLLKSICQHLRRELAGNEAATPDEYPELVLDLQDQLLKGTAERPIVLVIDALDQLLTGTGNLSLTWLPGNLPPSVHVIVSTTPGSALDALELFVPLDFRHEVPPMRLEETAPLLDTWLSDAQRRLQGPQRRAVLNACEAAGGLPLYLRLAFEEARRWSSENPPPDLPPDIPTMIRNLYQRLSSNVEHGRWLVERSLSYLAAAKNGLDDEELIDVLSADEHVMAEFRARHPDSPDTDSLPPLIWFRLFNDLEPYLSRREIDGIYTLSFFHRQLEDVIVDDYFAPDDRTSRHRSLVHYFAALPLEHTFDGQRVPQRRKLAELPYQLAHADMKTELAQLIFDFAFLQIKVSAIGPRSVIEDLDLALSRGGGGEYHVALAELQSTLMLASEILQERPDQLATQLHARLFSSGEPALEKLLCFARPKDAGLWLRPCRRSLPDSRSALLVTIRANAVTVAISPDASIAVSAGGDNLDVWDLLTLTQVRRIPVLQGSFRNRSNRVLILQDGVTIVGTPDGGPATAWSLATGHELWTLGSPENRFQRLGLSADGRWLLTGSDSYLRVWDVETRRLYRSINKEHDPDSLLGQFSAGTFRAAAITPDGRRVIVSNFKGPIEVWNLETGDREKTLHGCDHEVAELLACDDVRVIAFASACYDELDVALGEAPGMEEIEDLFQGEKKEIYVRRIVEWNIETGDILMEGVFDNRIGPPNAVALIPNSNQLISASNTGSLDVVELDGSDRFTFLRGHDGSAEDLAVYQDGTRVISVGTDGTLKLWDLERITESRIRRNHTKEVTASAFTPDGSLCATTSLDGSTILWQMAGEAITAVVHKLAYRIREIHMLPGGNRMFVVCYDKSYRLVDLRTFDDVVIDTVDYAERMLGSTVSTDGSTALTSWEIEDVSIEEGASFTLGVHVLDLQKQSIVRRFSSQDYYQSLAGDCIVFRPGNDEAISSHGNSIVRWSVETGVITAEYSELGEGRVAAMAVTPDGSRVILGMDSSLRSVDLETGAVVSLAETDGRINAMTYRADENQLFTVSTTGMLALWETRQWTLVASFFSDSQLTTCAVSPSGDRVVAGDSVGQVHVLRLEPPA